MPPRGISRIFYAALGEVLELAARRFQALAMQAARGSRRAREIADGAPVRGRTVIYLATILLGLLIGIAFSLAEPLFHPVDKIAACERRHTAFECRQTWIAAKGAAR